MNRESMPVAISAESIRRQLEKILASELFSRSARISRFLRYTVEQTLAGNAEHLKEYCIGVAVYDKPESLDTRFDPIVRVEAGRLRSKLRDYYQSEGRNDTILITFRKRSYVPEFELRRVESQPIPGPVPAPREAQSIAVLPFADISRFSDQAHFCDGLTEEIICSLARVEGVRVVARSSVFQFKGQACDVRRLGEQLGAGMVMEGSVRKFGNRVRITVQLNSASNGFHVWSQSFDGDVKDALALQDSVSCAVSEKFADGGFPATAAYAA